MAQAHHSIKAVARRTGLTPHVIRIWEKRYGAVEPERTKTNRRLYSEEEIERLNLLREATLSGHSIGQVAKLSVKKLRTIAAEASVMTRDAGDNQQGAASFLQESLAAVKALNLPALNAVLNRAATELGNQGLLQRLIAPLAQAVGELWRDGTITAAHEHFATSIIRIYLGQAARQFAGAENAPVVVVATPSGQLHELGALLVGAAATNIGWRVIYLGASLPPAEIAGVAMKHHARAVALSLVYPEDDVGLESELLRLRELLPEDISILIGGRAMPAYLEALKKMGALETKDLAHLCSILDDLRKPARKGAR